MYHVKLVRIPLVGVIVACGFLSCGCGRGANDEEESDEAVAEISEGTAEKNAERERRLERKAEKREAATGVSFGP